MMPKRPPTRGIITVFSAAAMVAVAACSAFSSDESSPDVPPDAAAPEAAAGEAASDASDAGGDATSSQTAPCASDAGPYMLAIPRRDGGTYCIDKTEVTQADYQVFLATKAGDTSGQIAVCAANETYEPSVSCTKNPYEPSVRGRDPVGCVDWCDAYAYCRWAGKRLCGAVSGGPLAESERNSSRSQWYSACTHNQDGQHAFAYGDTYVAGRCNGRELDSGVEGGAPIPVGAAAGCVGGFPDLHDMIGNVFEWEDNCSDQDGGGSSCTIRGGGFGGDVAYLYCAYGDITVGREFHGADLGFRCCR